MTELKMIDNFKLSENCFQKKLLNMSDFFFSLSYDNFIDLLCSYDSNIIFKSINFGRYISLIQISVFYQFAKWLRKWHSYSKKGGINTAKN